VCYIEELNPQTHFIAKTEKGRKILYGEVGLLKKKKDVEINHAFAPNIAFYHCASWYH
jgi:hypothetical protein